jgi:D-glycero-alpha-D-manno-heptose 1-phosphate guanylyltransferase
MKTLILAGGLGTRLRETVSDVPKSLAPVAGKPFLEWQIRLLKEQGFDRFVLCLGYRAQQIVDFFGDGTSFGVKIEYSFEEKPLGTAGAVLNAANLIDGAFMLLNGDTFFDTDYRSLVEFHDAKEAKLSMALTVVDDVSRFGSVSMDIYSRVGKFSEKDSETKGFGYINAGAYVIEPVILEHIDPLKPSSLEKEVIPALVENNIESGVFGMVSDGFFIDIGTPDSYETAQKFFNRYHKL